MMMTKKNRILLIAGLALVGLVALPLVATAEGGERGERRAKLKAACEPDVQRLCGGAKGKKAVLECLRDNRESLSAECADGLKKARKHKKNRKARRAGFRDACGADVKTHCGDIERGSGQLKSCIQENRSEFSASCNEFLDRVREKRDQNQSRD